MSEQRFTVVGRPEIAEPYSMLVIMDDDGLTLDGMSLDWNSLRAAMESMISATRQTRAVFGTKGLRKIGHTRKAK